MKLLVVNQAQGFVPASDKDYEEKMKLKRGGTYEITIKEFRNPKFHRLYFSLINLAWDFLSESQRAFFKEDVEVFRKTVEVAAGHCEKVYSVARREWLEVPKSIAFDKLSESDFSDLYERVKSVLYQSFITDDRKELFENQLRYY